VNKYLITSLLFILTFFTTTIAGVQWLNKDPLELSNFSDGLPYSISIMIMLLSHEMGHYFAAKYHKVKTSLPYFIPAPPFLINPFGTLGAVIRMRSSCETKRSLFDVGIAGPLSGLIVTIIILLYGFFTLPPKEYIFTIHPEYRTLSSLPDQGFTLGNSLLFYGLSSLFRNYGFVPPMNEIYHYPYLCVGWFGLFVTALNLLPVGQLDGGHILYAISGGKIQGIIARIFLLILLVTGLISVFLFLKHSYYLGSMGWLLWVVILYFLIKLDHPKIADDNQISNNRKILGWLIFVIFILIFPPIPFIDSVYP